MFYSNDHQPVHVHVIKDGCEAKYNVNPIEQVYNHGFKKHDIALRWVLKIPTANYNFLMGCFLPSCGLFSVQSDCSFSRIARYTSLLTDKLSSKIDSPYDKANL